MHICNFRSNILYCTKVRAELFFGAMISLSFQTIIRIMLITSALNFEISFTKLPPVIVSCESSNWLAYSLKSLDFIPANISPSR